MFRTKVGVWVLLIVLSIALNIGPGLLDAMFQGPDIIPMSVKSDMNVKLAEQLTGLEKDGLKLKINSQGDSLVILQDSSEESIPGYTKYSKAFTTPIVLFAPEGVSAKDKSTGFALVDKDASYPAVTKDLAAILTAIEKNIEIKKNIKPEDKTVPAYWTWAKLGVPESIIKGNVGLMIPQKSSPYYPAVVETMYLALNGSKDLTVEDVQRLKPRVELLLANCYPVEDIGQQIYNRYIKPKEMGSSLALGPECIIANNDDAFAAGNSNVWQPVYLTKTASITFDLFIKKDIDKEGNMNQRLNNFFTNYYMGDSTGLRAENREFELRNRVNGFKHAVEVVGVGNMSAEVKEEIKKDNTLAAPLPTTSVQATAQGSTTQTVATPLPTTSVQTTAQDTTQTVVTPTQEKPAETAKSTDKAETVKQVANAEVETESQEAPSGGGIFLIVVLVFLGLLVMALIYSIW